MNKLGERLRSSQYPEPRDLALLQEVRAAYDPVMSEVARIIREELGVEATGRLKTVNTIIDKLGREKTRLSTMQDIAGLRIVGSFDRRGQDALVERIRTRFPGSKVEDRRARPKHGYRAVHIIVFHEGRLVEIQVRTSFQDQWAQLVEKLGDTWGRDIRYGGAPRDPDVRVGEATRAEIIAKIMALVPFISEAEELQAELSAAIEGWVAAGEEAKRQRDADLKKRVEKVTQDIQSFLRELSTTLGGG